MLNGNYDYR